MRFFSKKNPAHSRDEDDSLRIIDDNTPFAVVEAFKTLYTKILYIPTPSKCKKIAITSAYPGEGKSYISSNLAITMAQSASNKRVLLVDFDMRKPRVAKLIKKHCKAVEETVEISGLSEFLAGIDETPKIQNTAFHNLDILFSGKENSNPIGLINSPRFEELISICEKEYDYVVFDCPPINIVPDALLISHNVNGYIMATRSDYSNINALSEAVSTLKELGAEVFGVVLSSVNPKKSFAGYNTRYANNYQE